MRKDYQRRVRNFHPDFIKDIFDTCTRIHQKDGKAYPLRITKSVAKRWKSVFRWKISWTLNYLEYLGILQKRLEDIDEYKARMQKYPGLFERGKRRVYFSPTSNSLDNPVGVSVVEYRKLSYKDLGVQHEIVDEYPV